MEQSFELQGQTVSRTNRSEFSLFFANFEKRRGTSYKLQDEKHLVQIGIHKFNSQSQSDCTLARGGGLPSQKWVV